ncbi:MAG: Permeases of the drug/metabolite transporter (DMT) superfamily, partial [Parcubacteria group bacterium GW2011_GWA2_46_7]
SGIIASFCLIRGFKYVEAQSGSLILPTELIFASVFGYFFLGEILKVTTYMGGFLIILAAIMPTLRSRTQHLK